MAGQGRTGGGEQEGEYQDNVVRFPRDWIGPLEDLVPIGSAAAAAADPAEPDPAEPDPAEPDLLHVPETSAVNGDAFWDERSDLLHQVVEFPRGGGSRSTATLAGSVGSGRAGTTGSTASTASTTSTPNSGSSGVSASERSVRPRGWSERLRIPVLLSAFLLVVGIVVHVGAGARTSGTAARVVPPSRQTVIAQAPGSVPAPVRPSRSRLERSRPDSRSRPRVSGRGRASVRRRSAAVAEGPGDAGGSRGRDAGAEAVDAESLSAAPVSTPSDPGGLRSTAASSPPPSEQAGVEPTAASLAAAPSTSQNAGLPAPDAAPPP